MTRQSVRMEYFYRGNRLKAELRTLTNIDDNSEIYTARLYTKGKKLVKQKSFFNYTSPEMQEKAYQTCREYIQEYLKVCKY